MYPMTMTDGGRRFLPMSDHVRGKRSAVTCQFKCANACLGPECNSSHNEHFRDIAEHAISRRAMLGLSVAAAVAVAVGMPRTSVPVSEARAAGAGSSFGVGRRGSLPFEAIAPVPRTVDELTVPAGYGWTPLIRWGDPLFAAAPAFAISAQTPEAQAQQFGYNCDYLDVIADANGKRGVLVANHEYVNPDIMFPPSTDIVELDRRGEVFKAAQGMSVVEVQRRKKGDDWSYVVGGRRNRRITVETLFELTGPAAGSALLTTAADPEGRWVHGTLGNCAGGTTPWGTVLSGEENFPGYFAWDATTPSARRYQATSTTTTSTGWERTDPRFNAHDPGFVNEPHRFGYIVEIDPEDPTSTPRKHTAMGRLKHEGANVIVGTDRRVVAYMGDDERNDYLYKFVTRDALTGSRKKNLDLLSAGDLYVAKFTGDSPAGEIDGAGTLPDDGAFDGTGEWIALTRNGSSAVAGMSIEEVLVHTRLAADAVGATKMDRPEDVQPSPRTGKVYVALTNNSNRGKTVPVDEANPVFANRYGHVLEITERDGQSGTRFGWSILLLCGDPSVTATTYFAGFPADRVSPISCPDNLAFDSAGDLWISTDGAPGTIGYNDGLFQVALTGSERGHVRQFLSVPREAETCGPVIHDQDGRVFVSVQHPGEEGTFAAPTSLFPDYGSAAPGAVPSAPRPSIVQVSRRS